MKKFISIILTVVLSLSVFSCVSCFADAEKSIYSDKNLLNELGWMAYHLDDRCSTWYLDTETEAEYVKRIGSSENTKNCIIDRFNSGNKRLIEPYNKNEVRNYLYQCLTYIFDFYRPNSTESCIKESDLYSLLGEKLTKACPDYYYKVFPNRVVEVFNEKYGLNKIIRNNLSEVLLRLLF